MGPRGFRSAENRTAAARIIVAISEDGGSPAAKPSSVLGDWVQMNGAPTQDRLRSAGPVASADPCPTTTSPPGWRSSTRARGGVPRLAWRDRISARCESSAFRS